MSYVCPRCQKPHNERFYGPCEMCREDLRSLAHIKGIEVRALGIERAEEKAQAEADEIARLIKQRKRRW